MRRRNAAALASLALLVALALGAAVDFGRASDELSLD